MTHKSTIVVALLVSSVLVLSGCNAISKMIRPNEFSLTMEKDFNDDGSSIDRISAGLTWRLGADKVKQADIDDSARRDKKWDQ